MSASRGMPRYWGLFKRDRFFLTTYFLRHTLALAVLAVVFAKGGPVVPQVTSLAHGLALLPLAVLLGIKLPTLMHNCMHGNQKVANDRIGELTSFFVLMNFAIVCLQHTLHHAYPDSDRDPHNPEGMGFWNYFFTSHFRGAGITQNQFLDIHGHRLSNVVLFKLAIAMHFAGYLLTLSVLYLALGNVFFWFYVPAFTSYLFVFSHVNYISHAKDQEGSAEILNLDTNPYYRFINFFCDGIYFHKNHHLQPAAYNPKLAGRSH